MPRRSSSGPLPDLVDESFDEAAFLWRRWEGELASLTRSLDEVWSWTEDRLHGALDGVCIGGGPALELAHRELSSDDVDRVTVGAAVLALQTDHEATDGLAAALDTASGAPRRAILRALELLGTNQALRSAVSVLSSLREGQAGALCRLKAFRRAPPGGELASAFASALADDRVDALRVARLASPETAAQLIASAVRAAEPAVQYAAIESGLCLGLDGMVEAAARVARERGPAAGPCLNLLALFGAAAEHEIVYAALRLPDLQRPAIWALGHLGTVRAIEACLAGMRHEPLARACGEAYGWITGADLELEDLTRDEPPQEVPAFEDDDLEADLVPAPDTLWPLPDPEAAERHWLERRSHWSDDARYIHGRVADGNTLLSMLERGPMLRRPDLALELYVRTHGRYDVETRAFTARQRQMMAAGRAAILTPTDH